ncbi:hypothetical protein SERLA73DRAFT_192256 [Serpula lacrymans var. lacrymans S7.3]|uniref:Uncharacterized protein n=1 Tax=Serpula lacrymans var. lacrymans (strain S7.3) TaxID=936435 RepID=F8QJI0_SERL3|nr:hypothetical protein SERLA73DRAFT_192256 [Serpula lacrymans var. lacrymans S7.3]
MSWLADSIPVTPLALGLEITAGVLLLLSFFFLFSLHTHVLSYLQRGRLIVDPREDIQMT